MKTNTTAAAVSSRSRLRRRIRLVAAAVTSPAASAPTVIASWFGSVAGGAGGERERDRDPGQHAVGEAVGHQRHAAQHDVAADHSAHDADERRGERAGADELGLERLGEELHRA